MPPELQCSVSQKFAKKEDEGVARPASFAEIVDDDVDVDEAPNLSV